MSKKKGEITPILPKPVSKSYVLRSKNVPTPIVAEDSDFIPQYKTKRATCDLLANIPVDGNGDCRLRLLPGHVVLVDCGFSIALPKDYEVQIRANHGLAVNGIVLIDASEETEGSYLKVKVVLINVGRFINVIDHKAKVAQMSIQPCWYFDFEQK